MYCPKCGTEFKPGNKFCSQCGQATPAESKIKPEETETVDEEVMIQEALPEDSTVPEIEPPPPKESEKLHSTKKIKGPIIALAAAAVVFICILLFLPSQTDKNIALVQNGYLGGYDDITIHDMLESVFEGNEISWDGGTTDSGDEIVQAEIRSADGGGDKIQFKFLEDHVFKVSAIDSSSIDASSTTDVLTALNGMYYSYYMWQPAIALPLTRRVPRMSLPL